MYVGSFGPFIFDDADLFRDGSPHRMHLSRPPILGDDVLRLTDIGGIVGAIVQVVPTATIADPIELNALAGFANGAPAIVAEIAGAALDPMTLYAWDSNPGAAPENPPYTVDGAVGSMWIAIGGLYVNQNANFNGRVLLPDGTALLPALTFVNDPNTGIWRPGADIMELVTGGLAGLRVDAAGDVTFRDNLIVSDNAWIGIGAALERIVFDAAGDISVMAALLGVNTLAPVMAQELRPIAARTTAYTAGDLITWSDLHIHNPSDTAGSATGISFIIDSAYHVNAGTGIGAVKAAGDYDAHLVFITRPNAAAALERMRITSDGDVVIGAITANAQLDNVGTTRLGDSVANYVHFAADGTLTLTGTARVTRSIKLFATISKPAATAPTEVIIGDFVTSQYSNAGPVEGAKFLFHIPEDWAQGTDMQAHIHWAPATGAGGNVKWDMNYTALASDANEVLTAAGVALTVTDATQALQDELLESANMTILAANIASEDVVGITLSRDNAVGGNYGADASLVLIEIEYISDRLGL